MAFDKIVKAFLFGQFFWAHRDQQEHSGFPVWSSRCYWDVPTRRGQLFQTVLSWVICLRLEPAITSTYTPHLLAGLSSACLFPGVPLRNALRPPTVSKTTNVSWPTDLFFFFEDTTISSIPLIQLFFELISLKANVLPSLPSGCTTAAWHWWGIKARSPQNS